MVIFMFTEKKINTRELWASSSVLTFVFHITNIKNLNKKSLKVSTANIIIVKINST